MRYATILLLCLVGITTAKADEVAEERQVAEYFAGMGDAERQRVIEIFVACRKAAMDGPEPFIFRAYQGSLCDDNFRRWSLNHHPPEGPPDGTPADAAYGLLLRIAMDATTSAEAANYDPEFAREFATKANHGLARLVRALRPAN